MHLLTTAVQLKCTRCVYKRIQPCSTHGDCHRGVYKNSAYSNILAVKHKRINTPAVHMKTNQQKQRYEAEWILVSEVDGGAAAHRQSINFSTKSFPVVSSLHLLPHMSRCPLPVKIYILDGNKSAPGSIAVWCPTFIMRPCTSGHKIVPFLFSDAIL